VPQALLAPLFVGVNYDLGVRASFETVASTLQFLPQLEEVVNFSVKYDLKMIVLITHGLGAALHINDAEPPMAKTYFAIDKPTFTIRSPMMYDGGHLIKEIRANRVAGSIKNSAYSAHNISASRKKFGLQRLTP
jgi:hypothetical protein